VPDQSARRSRNAALIARFAPRLPELFGDPEGAPGEPVEIGT